MKIEKLNLWYFVIALLILVITLIIEKFSSIEVDKTFYYIIIATSIAALGNYIVIRIQTGRNKVN